MEDLVEVNVDIMLFNYEKLMGTIAMEMGFISYPPRVNKDKSYAVLELDVTTLDASDRRCIAMKNKVGWKFHISLNQEIDGNVSKGWNILKAIVLKYKIAATKIIKPDIKAPENKVITIHAFKDIKSAEEWQIILAEITQAYVKHKIFPAPLPKTDYPIKGCYYFSHRSDDDGSGSYTKENIMPYEQSPYKNIVINVEGQQELLDESIVVLNQQPGLAQRARDELVPIVVENYENVELEFNQNNVIIQEDNEENGCSRCCKFF